ncbi:MAG: hypothetical protein AAGE94_16370 [Acidobacteriota bacterium]
MHRPKLRLALPLVLFSLVLVLPLWAGTLYYQASIDHASPHTVAAPPTSDSALPTRSHVHRAPLDLSTVYVRDRLR